MRKFKFKNKKLFKKIKIFNMKLFQKLKINKNLKSMILIFWIQKQ